jgi:hypothetical protein
MKALKESSHFVPIHYIYVCILHERDWGLGIKRRQGKKHLVHLFKPRGEWLSHSHVPVSFVRNLLFLGFPQDETPGSGVQWIAEQLLALHTHTLNNLFHLFFPFIPCLQLKSILIKFEGIFSFRLKIRL